LEFSLGKGNGESLSQKQNKNKSVGWRYSSSARAVA
jgi:hypothetical protein